ncbi:aminodeoxychorismate synthase component I [Mastigocoleus testarum]|uniref:aminodeoxychorismate synthase n=1 Tax=Mastigocoleus testarum BC008 TaxID=371196 RepID=A0A0V7ZKJ5_9CYAN|nr:aminodeoxychorismate synthase component I [Mastigocoleus testarum]KST65162.1 aminobenzoate synthetase [Mastigocoleus testarum BC008]
MKTLLIDNYDSYTFNLYQMLAEVNEELPIVIRNDKANWSELKKLEFDNVVISPGPGNPKKEKDFGICRQVIQDIEVPLLGVCLGHQGLGYVFGGDVIHASQVMHGRLSEIYHNETDLFEGIPQGFSVVRYHSLIVSEVLPECLEKVGWTKDKIVMALRHKDRPLWGVQFHPESICTKYGYYLLQNFRNITKKYSQKRSVVKVNDDNFSIIPKGSSYYPQQNNEYEVYSKKLDIYLDTEQVFVHLFGEKSIAFWLDSSQVEQGLSRFSFMGDSNGPNSLLVQYYAHSGKLAITQSGKLTFRKESIFDYLKRETDNLYCKSDELPFDFNCGFVGYFGYELKVECNATLKHISQLPDATFLLSDRIIVFDHQEQTTYLLCFARKEQNGEVEAWFKTIEEQLRILPPLPPNTSIYSQQPVTFNLSRSYQEYIDNIQDSMREITEGETYEVCLTNKISTNVSPDPLTLYRNLRLINPAPYSAFLRFDTFTILSSSPERFLKINGERWVESKPIKGTRARGKTLEADADICESLRSEEKDRAENLMIVDLLRNDLGLVCEIGSVHVPKLMDVETYATVHQLVSTIRGRLRPDMRAIDCIRMAFPGGSMTGAPKLRTMEIIDRLEQEARGIYSGAIGFLGLNGTTDLNITIRTAVVTPGNISIGVGGAIVALSDPQIEFDETLIKAQALIHAILLTVHGKIDSNQYQILGSKIQKDKVTEFGTSAA